MEFSILFKNPDILIFAIYHNERHKIQKDMVSKNIEDAIKKRDEVLKQKDSDNERFHCY